MDKPIYPRDALVAIVSASLRSAKPGTRAALYNGNAEARAAAAEVMANAILDALAFAEIRAFDSRVKGAAMA